MAMKTDELMSMVESLPIEMKARLVERILSSLHSTSKEIDGLWVREIEKRLDDIKSGKVKPVSSDKVFEEIQRRYKK